MTTIIIHSYLKASLISKAMLSQVIRLAMILINSSNSSSPFLSESTSFIISAKSDSVGFCPRDLEKENIWPRLRLYSNPSLTRRMIQIMIEIMIQMRSMIQTRISWLADRNKRLSLVADKNRKWTWWELPVPWWWCNPYRGCRTDWTLPCSGPAPPS